jgi:hypothetical protein
MLMERLDPLIDEMNILNDENIGERDSTLKFTNFRNKVNTQFYNL